MDFFLMMDLMKEVLLMGILLSALPSDFLMEDLLSALPSDVPSGTGTGSLMEDLLM